MWNEKWAPSQSVVSDTNKFSSFSFFSFFFLFISFFFVAKSFKATGRPKTRRVVCEVKCEPNHHPQSWKLCSFLSSSSSAPTKDALSQIRSPPWRSDLSFLFFFFSQHRSYRRKCHFSYSHQLVLLSLNLLHSSFTVLRLTLSRFFADVAGEARSVGIWKRLVLSQEDLTPLEMALCIFLI